MPDASDNSTSPGEGDIAQTDPSAAARKFHDDDTRHMIHELQGSVGGLEISIQAIDARTDRDSRKLDSLSRDNREMMEKLKEIGPKLDDVIGFIKHGVPALATKADLGELDKAISHRPTRRQAIEDLLKFGGLIGVIIGLFSFFSRAH